MHRDGPFDGNLLSRTADRTLETGGLNAQYVDLQLIFKCEQSLPHPAASGYQQEEGRCQEG